MARRKVKNGEENAWGQSFTRPVPKGRGRSGFSLVQETFVFSAQSEGSRPWNPFVCSYMQSTWRSQPFAMFILAVRGGFTQGGEKIQCQNKIQGKTFGISTIISPVNALDLSQVSTLFENQSKLSKCLMNTSVRKHSKSRRFALYVVPWRRETYFKSSKCLACQNRFVTMHQ